MRKLFLVVGILSILVVGCLKSQSLLETNFDKAVKVCQNRFGETASVYYQSCVQGQTKYNYACYKSASDRYVVGFINSKFEFIDKDGTHPCESGDVFV